MTIKSDHKALFPSREQSASFFLAAVLARLPGKPRSAVLDLGCGTGNLAFGLYDAHPDMQVTGLDISASNIAVAMARRAETKPAPDVNFVEADFLSWDGRQFDAIVADSVLHLITGEDTDFTRTLAGRIVPGGILIATMPHESLFNAALMAQRRLWRLLPVRLDRFALALSRVVYPREPVEILATRIGYLRLIPSRFHGPRFTRLMASAGLDLVEDTGLPSASFFKPRHRLLVFRLNRQPVP